MDTINVAAIQLKTELCHTEAQFRRKIFQVVKQAQEAGARVCVFPEDMGFLLPFCKPCYRVTSIQEHRCAEVVRAQSGVRAGFQTVSDWLFNHVRMHWFGEWISQQRITGVLERVFSDAARQYGMVLVSGSSYTRKQDGMYNVARVYGPSGKLAGEYTKNHLMPIETSWGIKASNDCTPINTYGLCIGVMLCYDLNFPDVCKKLTAAGAQFLCAPSGGWRPIPNFPLDPSQDLPQVTRAQECKRVIVRPYSCGELFPACFFVGYTTVVDGDGVIVAESKSHQDQEVIVVSVDLKTPGAASVITQGV